MTVRRISRQARGYKEIFAKDTLDKGVLFKMYKGFLKLNNLKNEQFDLKMGKMSEQTAQRKHTDKQISIGDGKSERRHFSNQQTKMDWNG